MDVIDGKWIKTHLSAKRGSRAALAEAMGLKADQISKIIKGERKVQAQEIPRVLAFFGLNAPPGLSEDAKRFAGAARPFKPSPDIALVAATVCPGVSRPFHYIAAENAPHAGILRGDVLILAHGITNEIGQLVLVSTEGESGEGRNELRQHFSPHLVSLDPAQVPRSLPDSDQEVSIIGSVMAVLRIPGLTAE